MMITLREHVPLAPFTSFGVGGPARFFVAVGNQEELEQAARFAEERSIPIFILVGGSNVVISDEGFPGLVIRMEMKGIEATRERGLVLVRVGAGESWDAFVARSVSEGWSGLECLSGIPGSVGAAPVQNIGAYGASAGSFVERVDIYDWKEKKIKILTSSECAFSYRDSIFKHPEGASYIITHVIFRLVCATFAPIPQYHDIKEYFGNKTEAPIVAIRDAIIEIRSRKGMVLLPGHEAFKSAGSFFKNPVVSPEAFARIEKVVADCPEGACIPPWYWVQQNGTVKIAAACLLEIVGFSKGYHEYHVGISPKHALSIINLGGARASDIVAFAEKIQKEIFERFGIALEREAQYIGF